MAMPSAPVVVDPDVVPHEHWPKVLRELHAEESVVDHILSWLAPDYGLLLDVEKIPAGTADFNNALRTGLAALRNATSEGYRAFVLKGIDNVSSFVENQLARSVVAMQPALQLVPFEDHVLADDYIRYRIVSDHAVVLFVLAALPRSGELTGASPTTTAKDKTYTFRSAGAGGRTVTWKDISDLLARVTPHHASQPSATVTLARVSEFGRPAESIVPLRPSTESCRSSDLAFKRWVQHGPTLTQGQPIPENFAPFLGSSMESNYLEFKQGVWYRGMSPDTTFLASIVKANLSKYLFRLLHSVDDTASPSVSLAFGIDKNGNVAGVPLPDSHVDALVASVQEGMGAVFPMIARDVTVSIVEVTPAASPAAGGDVAVLAWRGEVIQPDVPAGESANNAMAAVGLHVSMGDWVLSASGDDEVNDEVDDEADDEPNREPLLVFADENTAKQYAARGPSRPATVQTVPADQVILRPHCVVVVTFGPEVGRVATPAHFQYNWEWKNADTSTRGAPAVMHGVAGMALSRLTPPALWAHLRAARSPDGLWQLWRNPNHAVLLMRDGDEHPWVFLADGVFRADKVTNVLGAYYWGRVPLAVLILTQGEAVDIVDRVDQLHNYTSTGSYGARRTLPLQLAVVCCDPTCVGRALKQVADLRAAPQHGDVSMGGMWLLPVSAISELLQEFPAPLRTHGPSSARTAVLHATLPHRPTAALAKKLEQFGDLLVLPANHFADALDPLPRTDLCSLLRGPDGALHLPHAQMRRLPERPDVRRVVAMVQDTVATRPNVSMLHLVQCYAEGGATTVLRQAAGRLAEAGFAVTFVAELDRVRLAQAASAVVQVLRPRALVLLLDTAAKVPLASGSALGQHLFDTIHSTTKLDVALVVVVVTRWWPSQGPFPQFADHTLTSYLSDPQEREDLATFWSPTLVWTEPLQKAVGLREPHLAELLAAADGASAKELLSRLKSEARHLLTCLAALSLCAKMAGRRLLLPLLPEHLEWLVDAAPVLCHASVDQKGRHVVSVRYFWALLLLRAEGKLRSPRGFLQLILDAVAMFEYDKWVLKALLPGKLPFFITIFKDANGYMTREDKDHVSERLQAVIRVLQTMLDRVAGEESLLQTLAMATAAVDLRLTQIALWIVLSKMERLVTTCVPSSASKHQTESARRDAILASARRCLEHAEAAMGIEAKGGPIGFSASETLAYAHLNLSWRLGCTGSQPEVIEAAAQPGYQVLNRLLDSELGPAVPAAATRIKHKLQVWLGRLEAVGVDVDGMRDTLDAAEATSDRLDVEEEDPEEEEDQFDSEERIPKGSHAGVALPTPTPQVDVRFEKAKEAGLKEAQRMASLLGQSRGVVAPPPLDDDGFQKVGKKGKAK